jgi:hypothetical protein
VRRPAQTPLKRRPDLPDFQGQACVSRSCRAPRDKQGFHGPQRLAKPARMRCEEHAEGLYMAAPQETTACSTHHLPADPAGIGQLPTWVCDDVLQTARAEQLHIESRAVCPGELHIESRAVCPGGAQRQRPCNPFLRTCSLQALQRALTPVLWRFPLPWGFLAVRCVPLPVEA